MTPMTPTALAQYLDDLATLRGSGLPPGRTARMREAANRLRDLDRLHAERVEIEEVLHVADYCDPTTNEDMSLSQRVAVLASEAGRPVD